VGAESKLIVNLTRGNVICENVLIADGPRRRMRGLLGRESLPVGEGMLLQPAPSIHTAFMHFAFDVVFIDGTLRVVKVKAKLQPWRIASARHAWGVLELAEGEIASRGIALGDQLGVVEVSDRLGRVEAGFDAPGGGWTAAARSAGHRDLAWAEETRPSHVALGAVNGAADGSTRVLVVGTDRRFRSVTGALLTRRGCTVTLAEDTEDLVELIRREGPEVVVLDAGASPAEAAREAAQIDTLVPAVGTVVVGEEPHDGPSTIPMLAKWGSFDSLYGAIEQARPTRTQEASSGRR
jgi:hypothetical protein